MKVLVTGSSGHLGEALVRTLRGLGHEIVGLDMLSGPYTTCVGSVTDRASVRQCMSDVEWVLHTATLHRPHVDSHGRQDFILSAAQSAEDGDPGAEPRSTTEATP